MKSVLDPTFRYTPSIHTDLRKTFARLGAKLAHKKRSEMNRVRRRANRDALHRAKLAHK